MKYIIMCGGTYPKWEKPRQLTEYNGEPLVARTIRLLRENGVKDIAISTNQSGFDDFGVPVLIHDNDYKCKAYNEHEGYWCNAFYPMDTPVCYIFGDVLFSPDAIRTIVEYETDDIMLFASKPPFAKEYPKEWVEPFAFKVADTNHLQQACADVKRLDAEGAFARKPIAWELWYVICGAPLKQITNYIKGADYVAINDYTCDIDDVIDIRKVLT